MKNFLSCPLQLAGTSDLKTEQCIGRLSHHSNLACDFKRVLALVDLDVGLLEALGGDERVDLLDFYAVELAASLLDKWLGGALVDDERESVVVFDGLDHALTGQRVLHDGVLVPGGLARHRVALHLGIARERFGLGESESDLVPDLRFFLGMSALLHCTSCSLSLKQG